MGAVHRAAYDIGAFNDIGTFSCSDAIYALNNAIPPGGIVEFNDAAGRAKSEVLGAFDRAIAATAN
jgi:hypothetical protein